MALHWEAGAKKDLRELPRAIQKRIIRKVDFYAGSHDSLHFAKPMHHNRFAEYRFRIGQYRVLFDVRDHDIFVLAVGHRKNIYD